MIFHIFYSVQTCNTRVLFFIIELAVCPYVLFLRFQYYERIIIIFFFFGKIVITFLILLPEKT